MPYWLFTEDEHGRFGCLGYRDSRVRAQTDADDYSGIVHIKDYNTYDRGEAKRYFRGERVKRHGLDEGYKNIRNEVLSGLES